MNVLVRIVIERGCSVMRDKGVNMTGLGEGGSPDDVIHGGFPIMRDGLIE